MGSNANEEHVMYRLRSLIALGVGLTLALAASSCGSSDLPTADPSTQAMVSPNSMLKLMISGSNS